MSSLQKQYQHNLTLRYSVACAIARDAGKLAYIHFRSLENLTVISKGLTDLTSNADDEVEDYINFRLTNAFLDDTVLGEERGGVTSDNLWVVDPIDGTVNFLHGIPYFCVSIAYLFKSEIEIGIVYDPVADELFTAQRGSGAFCNGKLIRVSDCNNISKAIVGFDFNHRGNIKRSISIIDRLADIQCDNRRLGAGALMMSHVADGRFDGYWNLHLNSWDALAALLLVHEAGGWTNDFLADNGLKNGSDTLVCNPYIKDTLIEATGIY
ncbi:MAG: inositol monophosphatase family protein [Candidatus Hatepunaea meridiana]|nr:inositol monophosphatase family protein [Candidatus Hatepunaea meridiana]